MNRCAWEVGRVWKLTTRATAHFHFFANSHPGEEYINLNYKLSCCRGSLQFLWNLHTPSILHFTLSKFTYWAILDSIAASLFENDWLSWQIVPDDKIQTSLLLLWRGALTNMNIVFIGGKACFVGLFLILFLLARSDTKYLVAQLDETYISQPRHQRNIAQH